MKAPATSVKANTESMDAPEAEFSGKKMSAPAFALSATPPPPQDGIQQQNDATNAQSSGMTLGAKDEKTEAPANDVPFVPAPVPPVSPPQPPPPPAPAPLPTITIKTALGAADGSGKNRRRVGIGEKVTFTSSIAGDWTASAGDPTVSAAADTSFAWSAPNRAASATIAVKTAAGATANVVIDVLEPASITTHKIRELEYPAGEAGVGMKLHFDYHPMTVSFGNVEAGEVSGPASNITGYFSKFAPAALRHDSGDGFTHIDLDNRDTGIDTAGGSGFAKPWSEGGFDWVIPNRFRLIGDSEAGKVFTNMTQSFRIKANGEATVSKGAESATRKP